MVYRVCMVCLGNICRSPMAASVLRAKLDAAGLGDAVVVESAGTGDWHVGSGADHRARAALIARGYEDGHSARQFVTRDFYNSDDERAETAGDPPPGWQGNLVLAMDAANLRDLRQIAPDADIGGRVRMLRSYDPTAEADPEVPDPYFGGDDGFEFVLDQLERACDGLVEELRIELRPA